MCHPCLPLLVHANLGQDGRKCTLSDPRIKGVTHVVQGDELVQLQSLFFCFLCFPFLAVLRLGLTCTPSRFILTHVVPIERPWNNRKAARARAKNCLGGGMLDSD